MSTKKFNFRRWLYRWFGFWHKWQLRREARRRARRLEIVALHFAGWSTKKIKAHGYSSNEIQQAVVWSPMGYGE